MVALFVIILSLFSAGRSPHLTTIAVRATPAILNPQGDLLMRINSWLHPRRLAVVLCLALCVALSAVYAPIALQQVAGVTLTTTAYACGPQTGGGDC